jgi:hypothetical protein
MLKSGFPIQFLEREIAARRQATQLGLPVPPLRSVARNGSWFCESYVCGVPVNRVADRQAALAAVTAILRDLTHLNIQTLAQETVGSYLAQLDRRIQTLIDNNQLLSVPEKLRLTTCVAILAAHARRFSVAVDHCIQTALTHGDLQPANLLVSEETTWLIDWEYADRRQSGYDILVYNLRSRSPEQLAQRLWRFVDEGLDSKATLGDMDWPGTPWKTVEGRRLSTALFLLEEMALHLEENTNSRFNQTSWSFWPFVQEVEQWTIRAVQGPTWTARDRFS